MKEGSQPEDIISRKISWKTISNYTKINVKRQGKLRTAFMDKQYCL